MRVVFTAVGAEAPENGKTGRAGQTGASGTEASRGASGDTSTVTSDLDQARFSFDRTQVQSLEAQVLAQPEIREAKVQSLQQAIGNGEYSVPTSHVADALAGELRTGTNG
jgi:flagellar biosynthesis anti-sigma factor FlgM